MLPVCRRERVLRSEIGIRMALGASAADVVGSILRRMLLLAGLGVAAGVLLSLLGTRLLMSLLYGVSATDPSTFSDDGPRAAHGRRVGRGGSGGAGSEYPGAGRVAGGVNRPRPLAAHTCGAISATRASASKTRAARAY